MASNGAAPQQAGEGNMPLFYKDPMPLDAKKHSELSLKENYGFSYTEGVNAGPINLIEMPQVCHFYPIAFSPDGRATPVAILGLRDGENLFLGEDKKSWAANTYIPAYIRRYPFIFSELQDSDQLTLCVDQNEDIIDPSGSGQRFFDAESKPTELANNALEFCKSYHAAAQQTLAFSAAIAESGILIDREAQLNISGNKRIKFSGFQIIDEKKLSEIDDKTFLEWRSKGYLPFIYAHLFSGAQWQHLSQMLNAQIEAGTATI